MFFVFYCLHTESKGENVQRDADDDENDADDDGDLAKLAVKVLCLGAGNKGFGNAADGAEALLASALEDDGKNKCDAADEFNNGEDYTEQFHFLDYSVSYGKLFTKHIDQYDIIFCRVLQ